MFCFMKGHVLHFMLLRLFNHVVLASRWGNALHVEQVTAMVVFSNANTNTNTNTNANTNANTKAKINANSNTNTFHVDRVTPMVSFSDSQEAL